MDRGLLRRRGNEAGPVADESHPARSRQSADRTFLCRWRRAGRHCCDPHQQARARARSRHLVVLPRFRRFERNRSHRGPGQRSPRESMVLRCRSGEGNGPYEIARRNVFMGSSARAISRLSRRRSGRRRSPLDDRSRLLRRQHGLPRGARWQHRVSRRQHAWRSSVVWRRTLRHGRWRDHRHCRGRRDERRRHRGSHQRPPDRMAAHRERRDDDDGGRRPPARRCRPHRLQRDGALGRRDQRPLRDGRLRVRLPECQSANCADGRSGVHGARED